MAPDIRMRLFTCFSLSLFLSLSVLFHVNRRDAMRKVVRQRESFRKVKLLPRYVYDIVQKLKNDYPNNEQITWI